MTSSLRALALLALSLIPASLSADTLRVLWFAGSRGKVTTPTCLSADYNEIPSWAVKAASLGALPPDPRRVVIDSGAHFGTNPFCGFLLRGDEARQGDLVRRLRAYEPDLLLLGHDDFLIHDPAQRARQQRAYTAAGRKAHAVNVRCTKPEVCGFVAPEAFVWEQGADRVGFIPVTLQRIVGTVPAANLDGVSIQAMSARVVREVAKALSARGVTHLVLVARVGAATDRYRALQDILHEVPELDLALVDSGGPTLLTGRDADARVRFVNLDASPTGAIELEMALGDRLEVRSAQPFELPGPQDEAAAPFMDEFCGQWRQPLTPDAPDPSFWEPETFVRYMLEVLRVETASELSIWNRAAFRTTFLRSMSEPILTRGLLRGVYPFQNRAVVLLVTGAALKGALGRADLTHPLDSRVRVVGASRAKDGSFLINGVALKEARVYRIVTNDFLFHGGDGLMDDSFREAALSRREGTAVRGLLERFFEARRYASFTEGVTPGRFPDAARRPRWTFRGATVLGLDHAMTSNPDAYQESQLSKGDLVQLGAQIELSAGMETLHHRLKNYLAGRYKKSGSDWDAIEEVEDQVVLENTYEWTGFRRLLSNQPAVWLPSPYLRSRLETELEARADADHHHLQWTGSSGANWQLFEELSAYVGYASSRELLDDRASFAHGLSFGYVLEPWTVTRSGGRDIELTSRFDATYAGLEDKPRVRGVGNVALSVPILGPLSLSARYDVFLFQRQGEGLAYYHTTSLGLKVDMRNVFLQY
jgi:hypothetical protein